MHDTKTPFNESHTNPMGWDEFHGLVNGLIEQLTDYQREQGIVFSAVAPMLRTGGIPAAMIANKMRIIPMVPLQLKYNYATRALAVMVAPAVPDGLDTTVPIHILVVEAHTSSGRAAQRAAELLHQALPHATLHYVSVTRVFGGPETLEGYASYHAGIATNEKFRDDAPAGTRPGIAIYPWETAAYELEDINAAG